MRRRARPFLVAAAASLLGCGASTAIAVRPIVIVDADVGDDIDDAYALAWALRSPALDVRLVVAGFGDTALRARLVRRMLATLGRSDVRVGEGVPTAPATVFTQADWARGGPDAPRTDGIAEALDLIRRHPGQVTLVALAPLTDIGAMIARDPRTFGRLKAVVAMGGSVRRGYDRPNGSVDPVPAAEYNAARDPAGLRALLSSGVPVTLFPLDSTQVRPDIAALRVLTGRGGATTRMLGELTERWRATNPWKQTVPTLFDVVPVASLLDAKACPAEPMRLAVDDAGHTAMVTGPANARVCMRSDGNAMVARLMRAVTATGR